VIQVANPRYRVYVATITQAGVANPVATIIENTIGAILWVRSGAGVYRGDLANVFVAGKTWLSEVPVNTLGTFARMARFNASRVEIFTVNAALVATDALLTDSSIEIRVYF